MSLLQQSPKLIWQLQNLSSCMTDMTQLNAIHDHNNALKLATYYVFI